MKLAPFVFSRGGGDLNCFDEESPCVMEQFSACTIKHTAGDQSKFVPWLICMDTIGETAENVDTCLQKVGVDAGQVHECQKTEGLELLKELLPHDKQVQATPTVLINGVDVSPGYVPTYSQMKAALCKADPGLPACASQDAFRVVV